MYGMWEYEFNVIKRKEAIKHVYDLISDILPDFYKLVSP